MDTHKIMAMMSAAPRGATAEVIFAEQLSASRDRAAAARQAEADADKAVWDKAIAMANAGRPPQQAEQQPIRPTEAADAWQRVVARYNQWAEPGSVTSIEMMQQGAQR